MSKISVVIPVYKVEQYLPKCMDSVLQQTYRELEIILVDDGSPDDCGAICDRYAEQDERIRVIHKQNGGLSAARNEGMDVATGEYIIFIDSDDWMEPDYFARLFAVGGGTNADVICAAGCYLENENGSREEQTLLRSFDFDTREKTRQLALRVLSRGYPIDGFKYHAGFAAPWDKMYRLAFLREHGLRFDPECKMGEDTFFNICVFSKAERAIGTDVFGYHYRTVQTGVTRGYQPQKPQIGIVWLRKVEAWRLENYAQDADVRQVVDVAAVSTIMSALRCCYLHPANPTSRREVISEYRKFKQDPLLHRAIWSSNDLYYVPKLRLLKYMLRFPWLWLVRICWNVNDALKHHLRGR